MADLSTETLLLALAGSFVLVASLTFLATMVCLINTWGLRRRLRGLDGELEVLRGLVEPVHTAEKRRVREAAMESPESLMLEQHERRLQKRLKDLEGAIQQLRLEIVEQQTAKFQVNEAIRRAMAPTRGQG